MPQQFKPLTQINTGDSVAILSPSSDLAGHFPWVLDLGLERLRSEFGLSPIEYGTTRKLNATPEERAADVNNAFGDKSIAGIITTIGGEDEIKILPYLDRELIKSNPKPFFGYSDNTHIVQYLWNLGMPAYYGGSVLTQYAMQGKMHAFTKNSIKDALSRRGPKEITQAEYFTDIDLDWADASNLSKERPMEKNKGWIWSGSGKAEGILWGGCIESLITQTAAERYMPKNANLKDFVLYLETAESIPDSWVVEHLLVGLGERGMLGRANAVLVGRPKAWRLEKRLKPNQKTAYKEEQRTVIEKVVREYNPSCIIVQNMDFGHTDPQLIVPSGNKAVVDSKARKISFTY